MNNEFRYNPAFFEKHNDYFVFDILDIKTSILIWHSYNHPQIMHYKIQHVSDVYKDLIECEPECMIIQP